MAEKKKGLLGNLFTNKKKEEAEKAARAVKDLEIKKKTEEAQARAAQAKAAAEAKAAEEARKVAEEAKKRAEAAEAKLKAKEDEEKREEMRERLEEAKARRDEMAAPKFIAEHKLTADETLSHLSLKYYGSATRPYWMVIYEANKEVIGDNPAHVYPGLVVNIPELPEELKKDK